MTIYLTKPNGSYTEAIKFSMNVPNMSGDYQLVATSNYNKHVITFDLTIIETNDRYTEFATNYTDDLGDLDISGIFAYSLIQDTNEVNKGTLKFTNNKTKSLQNENKYSSPNENGNGYVIY